MDRAPAIHTSESHRKYNMMSAWPIPFPFLLISINRNRNRIATIALHPNIVTPIPNCKSKEELHQGRARHRWVCWYLWIVYQRHTARYKRKSQLQEKSRAALADKLDDIDQLAKAKKSLFAPDMWLLLKQRRKELSSRSKKNAKSNGASGLLASYTASEAHAKTNRKNNAADEKMWEIVKEWDILKATVGGP